MVYLTFCLILFNNILENKNMKNAFKKMLHIVNSNKNMYLYFKTFYCVTIKATYKNTIKSIPIIYNFIKNRKQ